MQDARWPRPARSRPLKCSRLTERGTLGGAAAQPAAAAAQPVQADRLCRICWEGQDQADEDQLLAPCKCKGSMRYVHGSCLRLWQQQLRAQKGVAASRRCDVCKAAWAKAHMPPEGPTDWRQLLRDVMRTIPWPAVLECYKFCLFAVGAVRGMQAGMAGFQSGMEWAAGTSRHNLEGLARWAPEMALAAGTMPPLKVPMALCLGAFVMGLAAQAALMSLVCAYAGSLVGFASGVAGCLVATLQLGTGVVRQGHVAAAAVASGAARGVVAVGRLAAPVVMGLLKALALSRVFA